MNIKEQEELFEVAAKACERLIGKCSSLNEARRRSYDEGVRDCAALLRAIVIASDVMRSQASREPHTAKERSNADI